MTTILIGPDTPGDILLLPHPRTQEPTQFLLTPDGGTFELLDLVGGTRQRKRSILLPDEILSPPDHFLLATPFDPVFFLIAQTRRRREGTFVPTDDLLDGWPDVLQPALQTSLSRVAVFLEGRFCRLDEARILDHLQAKVARVRRHLPVSILQSIDAVEGDDKEGEAERMKALRRTRQAVELIASYLPADTAARLRESYDFRDLVAHEETTTTTTTTNFIDPTEFIGRPTGGHQTGTKEVKKKPAAAAATTKKNDTKGMAPMTSFFAPKPKRQKT